MGEYWFTTLSAVRRAEPDWEAIAAYEPPLRRFVEERYAFLGGQERDDLVQEVLLAMRERLVAGYDASKGPFRPFLRTAIANRVRDRLRRRKAAPRAGADGALEAVEAVEAGGPEAATDEDAAAIDFEAEVVRAVRAFHDRRAAGPKRDRAAVYILSGALVDGLSNQEIAAREGLSADQVKRVLQSAREEILAAILASALEGRAAADVARAADLARACLREPRRLARLLEDEPDAAVRAAVLDLTSRLRGAGGGARATGALDFVRGVRAIFETA